MGEAATWPQVHGVSHLFLKRKVAGRSVLQDFEIGLVKRGPMSKSL